MTIEGWGAINTIKVSREQSKKVFIAMQFKWGPDDGRRENCNL